MSVFSFTLTVEGADITADAAQEALFEAGCGDATFSLVDGIQIADFDRTATDFAEAVASAIKAVESAVPEARVVAIKRETDVLASGS